MKLLTNEITPLSEKSVLDKKLTEINRLTESLHYKEQLIGTVNGLSGIALFQFYYAQYTGLDRHTEIGSEILTNVINHINKGYNISTYCNGIAGFGWVIDHLQQEGFIDINHDNMLASIDPFLYKRMVSDMESGDFDFLHGALGYGFYFLKRLNSTKENILKKKYRSHLSQLVDLLKGISENDGHYFRWKSTLIRETGEEGYNLSLSHGIASIINFLARLHNIEGFEKQVRPLLSGSIRYLLKHRTNTSNTVSLFPSWISLTNQTTYNSRLAWCYGDLGIGISLLRASTTLDDSTLRDTAIEILKHATHRKDRKQTFIKDAGLCHGPYGIAHIFGWAYKQTREEIFNEAYHYWIMEGIKMAIHSDGHAGYKKFHIDNGKEVWEDELCLLEGISGIGLVMIDYLSESNHNWDECILIS